MKLMTNKPNRSPSLCEAKMFYIFWSFRGIDLLGLLAGKITIKNHTFEKSIPNYILI